MRSLRNLRHYRTGQHIGQPMHNIDHDVQSHAAINNCMFQSTRTNPARTRFNLMHVVVCTWTQNGPYMPMCEVVWKHTDSKQANWAGLAGDGDRDENDGKAVDATADHGSARTQHKYIYMTYIYTQTYFTNRPRVSVWLKQWLSSD